MKYSIIFIILGILTVIGIGISEIIYLTDISEDLLICAQKTEEDFEKIDELMGIWEKNEKILSVLLDHQDIHKIDATLTEIEKKIKNNFAAEQVSTNFALLKLYIENITEEKIFNIQNIL